MLYNRHRMWIAVSVGAITLAATVTGCSSSTAGSGSSALTLTETKSSAQLLRNVVGGLLPAKDVANVTNTEDESLPCGSNVNIRSWNSAVTAGFDVAHQGEITQISSDLVTALKAKGWSAEVGDSTAGQSVKLTKSGSSSTIHVITVPPVVGYKGHGAQVVIQVTGPCVLTGGPNSTEVKTLEGSN